MRFQSRFQLARSCNVQGHVGGESELEAEGFCSRKTMFNTWPSTQKLLRVVSANSIKVVEKQMVDLWIWHSFPPGLMSPWYAYMPCIATIPRKSNLSIIVTFQRYQLNVRGGGDFNAGYILYQRWIQTLCNPYILGRDTEYTNKKERKKVGR